MAAVLGSFGGDATGCCPAQFNLYAAAISACEKGPQWQQALSVPAEVQKTAVLPYVISYNAAISAK